MIFDFQGPLKNPLRTGVLNSERLDCTHQAKVLHGSVYLILACNFKFKFALCHVIYCLPFFINSMINVYIKLQNLI